MNAFVRGVVLSSPLFLAGCVRDANTGPSPKELKWLRTHAIPITTPEAGHGFDDLRPLKGMIGDARIVALGECTHGTREVFQMKHRLLEYLASELGFTIFSIEANMPEAYRLNEYVLEGKGDPRQLIAGMYFWTWNTEEVLAMVEWMRAFNQSGKGRIEFTGFDMQTPDIAMDIVLDVLKRADPERTATVAAVYAPFRVKRLRMESATETATPLDAQAAAKACDDILETMRAKRDRYAAATSPREADWAIQNARVVSQCLRLKAGATPRDESMAENVAWILSQARAGTRIVLWGHNAHVSRSTIGRDRSMGAFLDERYGKEQLVVGFAAGEGLYTAVLTSNELRSDNRLNPPVAGSFESYFRASGLPAFFLDLRAARSGGSASEWLTRAQSFRSIGAMATNSQFSPTRLTDAYDGVVYFDKTSASRSLGRPGPLR